MLQFINYFGSPFNRQILGQIVIYTPLTILHYAYPQITLLHCLHFTCTETTLVDHYILTHILTTPHVITLNNTIHTHVHRSLAFLLHAVRINYEFLIELL